MTDPTTTDPTSDLADMSLNELLALRDKVSRTLKRQYEQHTTLLFVDVVGSTAYLARHGNVAGRALLDRFQDAVSQCLKDANATLIDTAGDGAFLMADSAQDGAKLLIDLQRRVTKDNLSIAPDRHLSLRAALHCGRALVDQERVTGESVHTTARLMDSGDANEIRLTEEAFHALPGALRALCKRLGPQRFKGLGEDVTILQLDWRDRERFATHITIAESGVVIPIGFKPRLTLGRMATLDGKPANDIVLVHPDARISRRISRWHANLEMGPDGYEIQSLGRSPTRVDGRRLREGDRALVKPGTVVEFGGVLTGTFRVSTPDTAHTVVY
ncbi:MAG: adenylate/guanylate cyclase domain-containing protein [Pseudomonadota bacterium]